MIRTVEALESRLSHIKTPLSLSVLGCVVNGPGEARETDIGMTGGGNGKHMVYLSGVTDHHVSSADMLDHIVGLVEAKAAEIEAATSDAGQCRGGRSGICDIGNGCGATPPAMIRLLCSCTALDCRDGRCGDGSGVAAATAGRTGRGFGGRSRWRRPQENRAFYAERRRDACLNAAIPPGSSA